MKISALTAATTPLSGAELFPIVQSGNTRRVSLNDLLRSIGNGTAAAPALAPGGDPNTGIYFPAADTIALVTGGNERLRVDANGNFSVDSPTFFVDNVNNRVGIGTTSPSSGFTLHVVGGTRVVAAGGSRAGQFEGPSATVGSGDAQLQIASTDAAAADAGAILRFTANTTPAANFPVATIAGRHQTLAAGNYSGYLQFNVASAAGGVSERMRLDSLGNLGLSTTPVAWSSSFKAFQPSSIAALWAGGTGVFLSVNVFNDGSNKYIANGEASRYRQSAGLHIWESATSGTAGSVVTFTNFMTLDASGRLGIGTTPSAPLHVDAGSGVEYFRGAGNSGAARYFNLSASTTTNAGDTHTLAATSATGVLAFSTAGVERARIASTGNVGIGTTSPQSALHVEGVGNTVAARIFTSDNVASATADLLFGTTPGARTKAAIRMVNTNTGNSEGALSLWTNNGTSLQERARIDGSGRLELRHSQRFTGSTTGAAIENQITTISVTTSTVTIHDNAGPLGRLCIVNGQDGGNRFCDLVLASTSVTPTVVQSFTAAGTPAARTYTRSGSALQLAMASGAYSVFTLAIGY